MDQWRRRWPELLAVELQPDQQQRRWRLLQPGPGRLGSLHAYAAGQPGLERHRHQHPADQRLSEPCSSDTGAVLFQCMFRCLSTQLCACLARDKAAERTVKACSNPLDIETLDRVTRSKRTATLVVEGRTWAVSLGIHCQGGAMPCRFWVSWSVTA